MHGRRGWGVFLTLFSNSDVGRKAVDGGLVRGTPEKLGAENV